MKIQRQPADIRIFLIFAKRKFLDMKTTTVALGKHFDEFIQSSVREGRYTNASEVIRAALRRLEEDERKIAALRLAIEEGESSGYVADFDFEGHLQELKERNNG